MTDLRNTGHVIQVFSSIMTGCSLCPPGESDGTKFDDSYLANRVNHLLEAHGCHLLHMGQQTDHDMDGGPWQMTVAVVGVPSR